MRAAAALLAVLLAAPGAAAPRKRRPAQPAAQPSRPARHRVHKEAPHPTDPTAISWPRRLAPGRWTPPAADALERLLQYLGDGATGYTTADPPAAVFVLDGAAMTNSPGDALFARLVDDAAFSFDAPFWGLLPPHYGAARARAGWESFKAAPRAVWRRDPHYLMYRKALHGAYASLCRDAGRRACARWQTALLTGLEEAEVRNRARQAFADALRRPVGTEPVGDAPEDPAPVEVPVGLRLIPEMRDLMAQLLAKGFDVWLLSPSSQFAALEAARLYGVHPTRVVGVRQKIADGRLTAVTLKPVPEGAGMAEAVTLFIGRYPALAVAGPADLGLLDYDDGSGLRILLAEPAAAPADLAKRGWVLQPPFSPVREPQEAAPPAAAAKPPEPAAPPAAP